jgi:hypothetical protein
LHTGWNDTPDHPRHLSKHKCVIVWLNLVQTLGADVLVDYTKEDVAARGER